MNVFVLNGWAADARAWDLCAFRRDRIFSYLESADGEAARALAESSDGAVLVGWSMGGSLALRLLLEQPDKVRGLVLVAATPRMMKDAGTQWDGMTPRRLEALRVGLELTRGEGFGESVPGRPNPYRLDPPEDLRRGLDFLAHVDLRSGLLALDGRVRSLPVAIFQSDRDGIVRPNNAAFLKSVFPQASLRMVEGTEHALSVTVPSAIDAAVSRVASEAEGRTCCVVSLGSNLGDRAACLAAALRALGDLPETRLVAASAVRETEPVDVPEEFAALSFLNQIAVFATALAPEAFSDRMHAVEEALGRVRTVRNGPRTVDLDLIAFDGIVRDDPALALPHPRFRERAFVLEPLAELGIDISPDGRILWK